jgi:hypothetical protein
MVRSVGIDHRYLFSLSRDIRQEINPRSFVVLLAENQYSGGGISYAARLACRQLTIASHIIRQPVQER